MQKIFASAGDETRTHTPLLGRAVGHLKVTLLNYKLRLSSALRRAALFIRTGFAVLLFAGDYKSPTFIYVVNIFTIAGDETRTHTPLLGGDFKSPVSAIPPRRPAKAKARHCFPVYSTIF